MILQMFEPGIGGVLQHVSRVTEHLAAQHRSTAVAYSSRRTDAGLNAFSSRLQAIGIPHIDMRVSNHPSPRDLPAFLRLLRFCRQVQPRLIHCHSSKAGMMGRTLGAVLRIPVVYTPHAYLGFRSQRSLTAKVSNVAEAVLGRIGHTVTVSSEEHAFATERLGICRERVVMITNGVDFGRFSPAPADRREAYRAELGVPQDRFVMAAIIRLGYQKDPLTLIKGFAIAQQQCPQLHLLLVGQGELADEVQQTITAGNIADHVTWHRHHTRPEVIYRAANLLGATSRYEGLPLVVLEALASNLPLVLSDCPGHGDFASLDLNALELVAKESPQEFAAGVLRQYQQRHRQPNHRERSLPHFSAEQCCQRHVSLYDALIAGTRC